jgi:hypothetical protein
MQMSEIDVWFSARLMIHCHGEQARIKAALRLADFQSHGDHEAARAWARIHQAIILLTQTPSKAPVLH